MASYSICAVNTALDSENRMHDDSVAAEYGFQGGLVPGVTVFGYMTTPVLEHFGEPWLERGAMSVRFKAPVYHQEHISIESRALDDGQLEISLQSGRAVAVASLNTDAAPPPLDEYPEHPLPDPHSRPPASCETLAPGKYLGTLAKTLSLDEARLSAPLPPFIGDARYAHPAILLSLANELLMNNVVLGPWIHAASHVTNFSAARDHDILKVHGRVIGNYERKGHELVDLDVLTVCGGRPVQHVHHTAIWKPRAARLTSASAIQ